MVAPGVRPAPTVLGLLGTVVSWPGPAPVPPVVLQGSVPPPHCACVRFRLVQPTVSNPVVATLFCTPEKPTSTPNLSLVQLPTSEPRAPRSSAVSLSMPCTE